MRVLTARARAPSPAPQQIAPGVHLLTLGRGPAASNVYLVGSDAAWTLVDAGWPSSAAAIKTAAEAVFGPGARPAAIVLTHIHPDHSGAAGTLARFWQVPVYVHAEELPMAAGRYLPQYAMPLDRWLVVPLLRLLPAKRRARIEAAGSITDVARPLDPQRAVPGLPDWAWVHTPGHTPGHVAYLRPSDGVAIAGDAALTVDLNSVGGVLWGRQRVAGPPRYTTWDWQAAKRSVGVLAELEPRVLLPGHGRPLTAGTATALHALAQDRPGPTAGGGAAGLAASLPGRQATSEASPVGLSNKGPPALPGSDRPRDGKGRSKIEQRKETAMVTTTARRDQPRRGMTAPTPINPLVRAVLGSPLHRLLSHKLLLITIRGRRTGRLHTLPVGYAQDGDTLYVLVGDYQTKAWWRNLQGGAPVQLRLRGRTVAATGSLLRWESDAEALVGALGHYLALFPAARRSLQITGRPDALDPEALRAAAHEVVMVRIRLAGDEPAATTAAVSSGTWDRPAQQGPR